MKKKLVFAFSVFENCIDNRAIKIHLGSLRYYKHIFDEALFVFMGERKYALPIIKELLAINFNEIQFKFREIDGLWESGVLYNEIVNTDENDDKLIFFGHTKGVTNYNKFDNELNFDRWITGLYFFNFEAYKGIQEGLILNLYTETFGTFKYDIDNELISKNKCMTIYCGSFYWLNIGKIKSHCKKMPPLYNRWYAELFPGDVCYDRKGMCYFGGHFLAPYNFTNHYKDGMLLYFNYIIDNAVKHEGNNNLIDSYNQYIKTLKIEIQEYNYEPVREIETPQ